MKKIVLIVLSMLLMVNVVFAQEVSEGEKKLTKKINLMPVDKSKLPTIAVFFDAPVTYANNEKIRSMLPEKIEELLPADQYNVLPLDDSQMALRTYREDNRMIVNQYMSTPLNREDIQKISQELKADYALFIIVNNDAPRVSSGLFSLTFRTSITCDFRLLDVSNAKYILSKQIVRDGSSTAVYAGTPSFDNAYIKALTKAFDDMTIDHAKIRELQATKSL